MLRSVYFWLAIGGLLLLVLLKFQISKVVELFKLLVKFVVNLIALFLGLSLSPFIKVFQESGGENE